MCAFMWMRPVAASWRPSSTRMSSLTSAWTMSFPSTPAATSNSPCRGGRSGLQVRPEQGQPSYWNFLPWKCMSKHHLCLAVSAFAPVLPEDWVI